MLKHSCEMNWSRSRRSCRIFHRDTSVASIVYLDTSLLLLGCLNLGGAEESCITRPYRQFFSQPYFRVLRLSWQFLAEVFQWATGSKISPTFSPFTGSSSRVAEPVTDSHGVFHHQNSVVSNLCNIRCSISYVASFCKCSQNCSWSNTERQQELSRDLCISCSSNTQEQLCFSQHLRHT